MYMYIYSVGLRFIAPGLGRLVLFSERQIVEGIFYIFRSTV